MIVETTFEKAVRKRGARMLASIERDIKNNPDGDYVPLLLSQKKKILETLEKSSSPQN